MKWQVGEFVFDSVRLALTKCGNAAPTHRVSKTQAKVLSLLIELHSKEYVQNELERKAGEIDLYKAVADLRNKFGGKRFSYISKGPHRLVPEPVLLNEHGVAANISVNKAIARTSPSQPPHNIFPGLGTPPSGSDFFMRSQELSKLRGQDASPITATESQLFDDLAERTYFKYRDQEATALNTSATSRQLAERYDCEPISIGDQVFPATLLWENTSELIHPDSVLGKLDFASVDIFSESAILDVNEYALARKFIELKYTRGPIKHESIEFCMTGIDRRGTIPKIDCRLGRYYDSILTQYAVEWELKKHLIKHGTARTIRPNALPLRESVEHGRDALIDGTGRCTALTVSMLMVFQRKDGKGYWTIIRRRSDEVGLSAGLLHVAPSGMFEATNREDSWSIATAVMREMLEEVYGETEQQGDGEPSFEDHIWRKEPAQSLFRDIDEFGVELSFTGLCCDLLNLRPEICTILFVREPGLTEIRKMKLNWESKRLGPDGTFGTPWNNVDNLLNALRVGEIVPSGLGCLLLGRNWLRHCHGI